MAGKVASFSPPPLFLCPPCPPAHHYNAGPLPPTPDTHINARSHTFTHTPCPREDTGGGGRRGFPNYLSRFQQMVGNFLQGLQLLQDLGSSTHVVSSEPPSSDPERTLFPPSVVAPGTSWIRLNHAVRLPDTFSGAGGGVLQGESVQPGRNLLELLKPPSSSVLLRILRRHAPAPQECRTLTSVLLLLLFCVPELPQP